MAADFAPIEISPEMIAAGVDELRERHLGDDLSEIAKALYLAMETQRLADC